MKRIAIIGAGIAGLSCAQSLQALGHQVSLFEKSRGVSGRASTRRLPEGDCDHGAQYFTAADSRFKSVVAQWVSAGAAALWTPHIKVIGPPSPDRPLASREPVSVQRYVGSPRMTAPAQYMASDLEVQTSVRIDGLRQEADGWRLLDEQSAMVKSAFDAVVLAIPPAQVSPIVAPIQPSWIDQVLAARLAPCWTVMAITAQDQSIADFDAAFVNTGPLSWIANNATKPGRDSTPIWTLQACADWSEAHLEDEPASVIEQLVAAFESVSGAKVLTAVAHRWRYARALSPSAAHVLWDPKLCLAACGDWLATGTVEGAWLSGQACGQVIHEGMISS